MSDQLRKGNIRTFVQRGNGLPLEDAPSISVGKRS